MAKNLLTDSAVERYRRPKSGRTEISDIEPGLFLWITSSGLKTWTVNYRLTDAEGKRNARRKKVIGRHPGMGVAEAREHARSIIAAVAEGDDPEAKEAKDKAAEAQVEAERLASSFRAVAEQYVAAMKAGKLIGGRRRPVTQTTALARERLLYRHALPAFGDKPIADITSQDVGRTLARIEQEQGPVDEALKVIRGTFKFALSRGLFSGSLPTTGMTSRQPPQKETRSLTDDELRSIWGAAGKKGWPFGSVIRLLMLTGQRKTEIGALRWEEVDWSRKLLVISANRVKNRARAHEVPLTEPAIQILREARASCDALHNRSGLVFPSHTGETPISGWNKLKAHLDRTARGLLAGLTATDFQAMEGPSARRAENRVHKAKVMRSLEGIAFKPWRIHDLRHTFITRCRDGEENEEGEIVWSAPLDILQATVNHQVTSGVTATYDHGDVQRRYRLRKRKLMDWWSGRLMMIVGSDRQSEPNFKKEFVERCIGGNRRSSAASDPAPLFSRL